MKRKKEAITIEAKEEDDEQVERKEVISVLDNMLKVIPVLAESPSFWHSC